MGKLIVIERPMKRLAARTAKDRRMCAALLLDTLPPRFGRLSLKGNFFFIK